MIRDLSSIIKTIKISLEKAQIKRCENSPFRAPLQYEGKCTKEAINCRYYSIQNSECEKVLTQKIRVYA